MHEAICSLIKQSVEEDAQEGEDYAGNALWASLSSFVNNTNVKYAHALLRPHYVQGEWSESTEACAELQADSYSVFNVYTVA